MDQIVPRQLERGGRFQVDGAAILAQRLEHGTFVCVFKYSFDEFRPAVPDTMFQKQMTGSRNI